MTIRKPQEFAVALTVTIAAVFFYYETYNIHFNVSYALGPLFFPRVLLGGIIILSLVLAIKTLGFTAAAAESDVATGAAKEPFDLSAFGLRAGALGALLAYLLLLPYLNYMVSTTAFLFILMTFLGERTLRAIAINAASAIITAVALKFIFGDLLNLFLP